MCYVLANRKQAKRSNRQGSKQAGSVEFQLPIELPSAVFSELNIFSLGWIGPTLNVITFKWSSLAAWELPAKMKHLEKTGFKVFFK